MRSWHWPCPARRGEMSSLPQLRRLRHAFRVTTDQPTSSELGMRGLTGKVAVVNGVGPAAESGSIENIGASVSQPSMSSMPPAQLLLPCHPPNELQLRLGG